MHRRNGLSVWWLDLGQLDVGIAVLADCLLTDTERKRLERLLHEADKLRFAAGRSLVRVVLSQQFQCQPGDIGIGIGKNGRPELADRPDGPWFNLSHSGTVVALAVASFPYVGIDTEEERSCMAVELAPAVCTQLERSRLTELDREVRTRRFFELWALKEAYTKARSEGLGIDPQSCEFDPIDPPAARSLPDLDGQGVETWCFRLWRIVSNQSLAVAFRPPSGQRPGVAPPCRAEAMIAQSAA